jgi:NADH-ubiquinone oxidoreductase chain 1
MTEHSAVIFVFFFLAEYASIVLICIFTSVLFLGGYLTFFYENIIHFYLIENKIESMLTPNLTSIIIQGVSYSLMLGIKTCLLIFIFI